MAFTITGRSNKEVTEKVIFC
ncbi:hypothetical protein OF001_U40229 [Pseudomonas sp. OF001]|nr:hypothetical protein OF001_U40229 [Pseudomonas sp. OF001]